MPASARSTTTANAQPGSTLPCVRSPTQPARPMRLCSGVTLSSPFSAAATISRAAACSPSPRSTASANASAAGCSASISVLSPGLALPRSWMPCTAARNIAASVAPSSSALPLASRPARIRPEAISVPIVEGAALLTFIPAVMTYLPRSSSGAVSSMYVSRPLAIFFAVMPRSPSPIAWSSSVRRSLLSFSAATTRRMASRSSAPLTVDSAIGPSLSIVKLLEERGMCGRVEQFDKLVVGQAEERERRAGHLHRGGELANVRAVDLQPALGEDLVHLAVHDVQLLKRRRAKPVDHHRKPVAFLRLEVVKDGVGHPLGDLVGGLQLLALHARLAVDAHADLHLVLADGKGRRADGGQRHRREAHADNADVGERPLGNFHHLIDARALVGFGAGDLEGEHHACDTAAAVGFFRRGGGHVVTHEHRARLDVVHRDHLGSHVEVHHIAAVVAVDVHHALAAVDALGDVGDLLDAGRLEHVADGAAVQHTLADIAEEHRQVAGAAAGHQADLALYRGVGPNE